jgi:geranylgeranyl pyrophosphate synthase
MNNRAMCGTEQHTVAYETVGGKSMGYTDVLDEIGQLIEKDLSDQFKEMAKEAKSYHPFIGDIYEAAEEFVLRGGKRLSSCSTLVVYKGYTNKVDEGIVRVSSGVELYRHSILAHDDISDNEETRRGGKTLHRIFGERLGERFGLGSSILIGNMLYSLAIKSVLESGFPSGKLEEAMKLISTEYTAVNESQILDLLFEYKQPDVKEWEVMASKRAVSLFRMAMLTGAILASAPEKDMDILEKAAEHIGYAFDVQDDIIDTFASKDQYGREPGGDISKRKKPLHMVLAMEKDRRVAEIMSGKDEIPKEDVEKIKGLMRSSGALDAAKAVSRNHAKEAKKLISSTEMNAEAKEFFTSFIDYVADSLEWYK